MKFHYIFLTIFACVFNMVVASHIPNVEPKSPRTIRTTRETSTDRHRYKCYEELTLKTDALLAEVKNKSLLCAEVADYQKKSNFLSLNELQSVVAEKMKTAQDSLAACSKITTAQEYFDCIKSFEGETRAVLDYVNLKSDQYFSELHKIEHDERHCLSNTINENKSMSAFLDLMQCIVESTDSIATPPSSTSSSQSMDEAVENIAKIKNIYHTLRNCAKLDEDGNGFHKCWYQATNNTDIVNYLGKHPSEYFSKLNEIDKTENSCLRHFMAEYLSHTFISSMELENCVIYGRAESSHTEEINDDLIRHSSQLFHSLMNCRSGNDRAEIEDCINGLLTGDMDGVTVDLKFYAILNENIEKIITPMAYDQLCLSYVLKKLQFNGVFMDGTAKEGYEACFYSHVQ